jgi:hypothetical protein
MGYTGKDRPHLNLVYASSARGLLGTRAITDLGGGVHFGAFSDGFWFLSERGEWNEAGIATEGGLRYRKWTDYIYSLLSKENAYRTQVSFDSTRRLVYISWPLSSSVFFTLIYDVDLDEMYQMDYSNDHALAFLMAEKGTTSTGGRVFTHANTRGFVMEYTATTSQRNGAACPFTYGTHPMNLAGPYTVATELEGWLDVYGHAAATSLAWALINRAGTTLTTVSKSTTTGFRDFLRFPFHQTDTVLQHNISGNHPITIRGLGSRVERSGEPL